MKITIGPSSPPQPNDVSLYRTVTIDTGADGESTHEAVYAALDAIKAYEHHVENIAEAAMEWANENLPTVRPERPDADNGDTAQSQTN